MLAFFFHHRSRILYVVEALAIAALAAMPWRMAVESASDLAWIMFAAIVIEYGFIRYCASRRWYKPCLPTGKDAAPLAGIELQFRKAMSPTVYVIAIGGLMFQWLPSAVLLVAIAVLLAVIAHVNVILIVLHHRDPAADPVNFLTRGT